jgi:hypothetical protein
VCVKASWAGPGRWGRILKPAVDYEENTPVPVKIDVPATRVFLKAEGHRRVIEMISGH